MQLDLSHVLFQNAIPVIQQIEDAGFEAFFVGGCVRDLILNRSIHDIDIATSAQPQEIKHIFERTIDIGIEHGTVMVLYKNEPYEVTTYRSEGTYTDHRRPDYVSFVRDLKEDLLRRDFTMNALALAIDGRLIDYYHGRADILRQQITCVGNPYERFNEDALRIMRAFRFMAQLDFAIEQNTLSAISDLKQQLKMISIERITLEWHKLCLGQARRKTIQLMLELGVIEQLPEVQLFKEGLLKTLRQTVEWKDEADIWATLLFFSDHSEKAVYLIQKAYKLSNQLTVKIKQRLKGLNWLTQHKDKRWNKLELYELKEEIEPTTRLAKQLIKNFNDVGASLRYERLTIHSKKEIAISGKDLKAFLPPSPLYGIILNDLERQIVLEQLPNNQTHLIQYIKSTYKEHFYQ